MIIKSQTIKSILISNLPILCDIYYKELLKKPKIRIADYIKYWDYRSLKSISWSVLPQLSKFKYRKPKIIYIYMYIDKNITI